MSYSSSLNLGYCQSFPTKIESYFHHKYFMDHKEIFPTAEEYFKNFGLTYLLRESVKKRNQSAIFTSTKNSEIVYYNSNN
jgi:hypothetical protein